MSDLYNWPTPAIHCNRLARPRRENVCDSATVSYEQRECTAKPPKPALEHTWSRRDRTVPTLLSSCRHRVSRKFDIQPTDIRKPLHTRPPHVSDTLIHPNLPSNCAVVPLPLRFFSLQKNTSSSFTSNLRYKELNLKLTHTTSLALPLYPILDTELLCDLLQGLTSDGWSVRAHTVTSAPDDVKG